MNVNTLKFYVKFHNIDIYNRKLADLRLNQQQKKQNNSAFLNVITNAINNFPYILYQIIRIF